MNLPSTSDLSVYQLAVHTLAPLEPVSVSLPTVESLLEEILDVLIATKIPATLWIKPPARANWLAQLKRYQQQVETPQNIYLCYCLGDQLENTHNDTQIFPIQLAAGSQLKREYFFIVISEQLNTLLVASQPEPRAAKSKTQPLLTIFSTESQAIQRVLQGISGVIAVADTTPNELLEGNTPLTSRLASQEKTLLTQLLVKQVQRTEKLLQKTQTKQPRSSTPPATPSPVPEELRDKGALLKRVAQELRTPLTNMKTALRLLDATQLKSAQRERYMQLLHIECDRQNSLIGGLLALVQLDDEPQPTVMPSVQLADILPGVISTYQSLAQEKGIQLGYTIPAGLPPVSCLDAWLRQIVINLLHNSLKFTAAGGQVQVQVTLQGDYVQLVVEDTGIGIAANEIPRIFDSFYRGRATTSEDNGAGLGLTIVSLLLLRCGGSISVTSKVSEGSCFRALFPVTAPNSVRRNA